MSFFLNDDLELLKQSAQEFTEKYVAPCVAEMEETNEFPRDLYLKAGELGFLSLIVPEQIGGMGLGLTAVGVVTEEIAKVSPAFAISYYVGELSDGIAQPRSAPEEVSSWTHERLDHHGGWYHAP